MKDLLAYASEHPIATVVCIFVIVIASFAWMTRK